MAKPRMILLKFVFTNSDAVPANVKKRGRVSVIELQKRENYPTHEMAIQETENCSLEEFCILEAGYTLVDAFYRERSDRYSLKKIYHEVSFWFVKNEFARTFYEFEVQHDILFSELNILCQDAFWRIRAYVNPFFEKGAEVSGEVTVSINFDVRRPRFQADGKEIKQWKKDEGGRRIGNGSVPIQPAYYLRMQDNKIGLFPG